MWQYPLEQWTTLRRGSVPFGSRYPKTKAMGKLGGQRHVGIDVMCPTGTPVYAPCDGFVQTTWGKDGGNTILFKEEIFGYLHRMLHNSKFVKRGHVQKGDLIAYSGKTGKAFGAHVHYDISRSGKLELGNFDNFIDPEQFFKDLAIEEIKKNMKVKFIIDQSLNYNGIVPLIQYVETFWSDTVIMEISPKVVSISDVPFVGDKISRKWLAENIVPYASGYDALALWLPPEKWKNFDDEKTVKAYTIPDKILGVQVMCLASTIGSTDKRWHDIPDQNDVAGKLRHELAHCLYLLTKGFCYVNNGTEYAPGDDNTHYFEFVKKDLSLVKKDLDMQTFEGWELRREPTKVYAPLRMFKYTKPTSKKTPFSGTIEIGKVYRSSDDRMFFKTVKSSTDTPIIVILTEQEYQEEIKNGAPYVTISVAEANNFWFHSFTNLEPPELKTKIILERIARDPFEYNWLRLRGWLTYIPTNHLT